MAKQKTVIERPEGEDSALTTNVQVLPALPGEDAEDAALVEAAVADINETWRKGGLETARKIGELIVTRFFDGDTANAHSRKRTHKSYHALATHKGLKVAASNLWYCVAVFEHFGVLPVEIAEALTVGHHRVLSHVQDVDARTEFARVAVAEHLSVSDLKEVIADKKVVDPNAPQRGRPKLVPVVKHFNDATKALETLQQWDAEKIASLTEKERVEALAAANAFAEAVASWWSQIQQDAHTQATHA
jgi:hypothetical protein